MKKINERTILKQGEKEFKPLVSDGVILWMGETDGVMHKAVAQSSDKLIGVPVVSLDGYVERLANEYTNSGDWLNGYNANPNSFTLKDIERAIELARNGDEDWQGHINPEYTKSEIIEQITSIQSITVNEKFEIISFE
jgi:hypothetical protein